MPYLGDYVGKILSEIANARFQADLEAVRLAELYLSHPLLRHLPVPHFRIPTLTLDVPVAIRGMTGENGPDGRISFKILRRIHRKFDALLETHLKQVGIVLSKQEQERLHSELTRKLFALKQPLTMPLCITHIADDFTNTVLTVLREMENERADDLKNLADNLKEMIHVTFSSLLQVPARLDVLVTSDELQRVGPSDFLARLHFSISEEGVEWSVIESNEQFKTRLVRE